MFRNIINQKMRKNIPTCVRKHTHTHTRARAYVHIRKRANKKINFAHEKCSEHVHFAKFPANYYNFNGIFSTSSLVLSQISAELTAGRSLPGLATLLCKSNSFLLRHDTSLHATLPPPAYP